ncbi:hypothetical protein B0O80DRAFT_424140 [Mortierella sp. GBAus27b]|nr:hypothetical protein B0O80DRAFT_424140 [Mortierella sp. GBAus27b]
MPQFTPFALCAGIGVLNWTWSSNWRFAIDTGVYQVIGDLLQLSNWSKASVVFDRVDAAGAGTTLRAAMGETLPLVFVGVDLANEGDVQVRERSGEQGSRMRSTMVKHQSCCVNEERPVRFQSESLLQIRPRTSRIDS